MANHSLDHSRSGIWGRTWYWKQQLTQADEAIHTAGGPAKCEFFRPPMGFKSWRMAAAARHTGHRIVMWRLRGRDGVPTTAEAILGRILPRARAGDIIVLHEGAEPGKKRDPAATIAAVPGLIAGLRAKGLEPVRLDELLGEAPVTTSARGARESRSGRAAARA